MLTALIRAFFPNYQPPSPERGADAPGERRLRLHEDDSFSRGSRVQRRRSGLEPERGLERSRRGFSLFGGAPRARRGRSVRRAEAELRENLGERRIVPGETYVVQLDAANDGRNNRQLKGRTYVFRADADGDLRHVGNMPSSSQPMNADGRQSSHRAAQNHGYAYLREGCYHVGGLDRDNMYGTGSYLVSGTGSAMRDGNYDGRISAAEAAQNRSASRILFHDDQFGSAGCQVVQDMARFQELVGPRGFTYVLVRDGDGMDSRNRATRWA